MKQTKLSVLPHWLNNFREKLFQALLSSFSTCSVAVLRITIKDGIKCNKDMLIIIIIGYMYLDSVIKEY